MRRSSRATVEARSLTTGVMSGRRDIYLAPRGSGCPGLQFHDPGRDDPHGGAGGWCVASWRERVHAIVEPRSGLLRPGSAFPGLPEPPRGRRAPPRVPDVERVRHDCDLRSKAQPFLHREEVRWPLLVLAFAGTLVGGWFGARWAVAAARRGIRRIVQEELRASRS